MLLLLRPEWGGSETMMLNYLRQQERAGFPQIQKLWAAYHAMVAHYLAHFADDPKGALERATMAAQLFPKKYNPRLFEMMDAAGRPRPERQRVLDEILLHLDDSTDLGTNFYISFMHVKDWPSHYTQQLGQHMLRQAERGDDESLLMLGRYHIYRPQYNMPGVMPLLLQARDMGSAEAAALIVQIKRANLLKPGAGTAQEEQAVMQDVLKAADLGNADMCWEIIDNFKAYQAHFGLDEDKDRLRYLAMGADGGNEMARTFLGALMVENVAGIDEEGNLYFVDGFTRPPPTQRSLDYGHYLLERAAANGNGRAQELLATLPEWRWDASEILRRVPGERGPKYGRDSMAPSTRPSAAESCPAAASDPGQDDTALGRLARLWNSLRAKRKG